MGKKAKRVLKYLIAAVIIAGVIFIMLEAARSREVANESATIATTTNMAFTISSSAFENDGVIPTKYTCDGDRELSPPLTISGVPEGTKSLVLMMDDPDVPKVLRPDGVFDHWVVFNIPADTKGIPEGGPPYGTLGANGASANAYTGPCPPSQYEPSEHRYIFKLCALDVNGLALSEGASKQEVLKLMSGHIIATAELIGRYSRK